MLAGWIFDPLGAGLAMQKLDLGGTWTLTRADGEGEAIAASVPGCVHTDLLDAGRIPDPCYRDNEDLVQWVSRVDGRYARTFDVPADLLAEEVVVLRCEGLDTLAEIRINGRRVAKTDNMFRTWEFDVKDRLVEGENGIEITFGAPQPYIERRQKSRALPYWGKPHKTGCAAWLRKKQCDFGWDWGPQLATSGIWRDLSLVGFSGGRLGEVELRQAHGRKNVTLSVAAAVESASRGQRSVAVTVRLGTRVVAREQAKVTRGKAKAEIVIDKPRLWWPAGMGDQPLYEVTVDLLDAEGGLLDTQSRRVGLRTVELVRKKDRWGESFRFRVNGVDLFAKGANWIPADALLPRLTAGRYRGLLESAAAANMNMLRVWGGGIYEEDVFYDLCDELGLLVWQDFMFACSGVPTFDEAYIENFLAEAEDNVLRLRHHACLAIWCGNNELEQGLVGLEWTDGQMSWDDYKPLFDRLLPRLVGKLDPDRPYWPSSAHTPHGDRSDHRDPTCGDAHLWQVWHGKQPFEWYRTAMHRFCSEFGFQSFPEPKTVRAYTAKQDRNVTAPVMEHHQRSGIGNATIMHYMLDWFRLPKDFESTLWVSQILQSLGMQYGVEHWRRNMPRCMGALYWQLNDCWPVASWASIDSFGRWKALQYVAARFFAPVLVSLVEDAEKGTMDVHISSDVAKGGPAELAWTLVTPGGEVLARQVEKVRIPSRGAKKVITLDLSDMLAEHGPENLMLLAELHALGEVVSTNYAAFAKPKRIELQDPQIDAKIRSAGGDSWSITLSADKPALWTWLEVTGVDATLSDNFVHLGPGREIEIELTPVRKLTKAELAGKLKIRSLWDTYR